MAVARRSADELRQWIASEGGIAHRDDVLAAGFGIASVREVMRFPGVDVVRRAWIALDSVSADLRAAARAGGRVTCVSLARRRGWWMPDDASGVMRGIHVHLVPGSGSARLTDRDAESTVVHWSTPLVPSAPRELLGSVEDALAHIARCLPAETALVLWESASAMEKLAPEALRAVRWTSRAARELAERVTGLADSGLETLVVTPVREWGLPVQQQAVLVGRPVDLLIGERLVVQVDGYGFHASSAQRTRDIAHDAELRLRGFTVLRFSYAQVVHDRPAVLRAIRRAIAAGLHLAA